MARIGIALSDERQIIAQPLTCIACEKSLEATVKKVVEELAKHSKIETIVIGLPLHMSGKESPMSEQVRKFAALLEKHTPIPIVFFDERLTTALVERALKEAEMNRKKRKTLVDALAATVILQTYMAQNECRAPL